MAKKKQSVKSKPKKASKALPTKAKSRPLQAKAKTKAKVKKKGSPARKTSGPRNTGGENVSALERFFSKSPVIEKESGKIRVLVGKAGLDGHDRGAKVIARAFRDAGFEVVYTGLHQTAEMIVNTAIQEDVDVLGLSILSGAHNYLVPEIASRLKAQGVILGKDMLMVIGGIIPESDFAALHKSGVSMVFTPGSSVDSIITFVREHVKPKA